MVDLRIQKTKKNLKTTLIQLLDEKSFSKISVTDICKASGISRITFYTHYDHKIDLMEEIFSDYVEVGRALYFAKQKQNNPTNNNAQCYVNVLDCIYEIIESNPDFFKHVSQEENPYLLGMQNRLLTSALDKLNSRQANGKTKYSVHQISGFVLFGLAGFIDESTKEGIPMEKIKADSKKLIRDLFESSLFTE